MPFDPNKLYYKMCKYVSENKHRPDKIIIFNEGGSRSSKTWDYFHFLYTYCDHNRNSNKDHYILRNTLVNCKDYTLKEFVKCMQMIGIECNPITSPKPYFNLFGNNIYFRGLDDEKIMEGFPSSTTFVNEALETKYNQIAGIFMRCTEIFAMDCNPTTTLHEYFDWEKTKENILCTKTTYKDNKHCPIAVIKEIESYEPTPENIARGTADEYRWKVYGLGERASRSGLVHPDVIWIDEFPKDVEKIGYGMDFGFTNSPSAIVKVGRKGNNLYLQKMFYAPTKDVTMLYEPLRQIIGTHHITADSADKQGEGTGFIRDLRAQGFQVISAKKYPGSVKFGIDLINRHKVHIVRDVDFRKEQENRVWKEIGGISLNEPAGGYDHLFDATAYCCMTDFQ